MTSLFAQTLAALVVLVTLILLLLTGFLLWLQRRSAAEQDRQHEAQRHQWLAARWPSRFPPSWKPPTGPI